MVAARLIDVESEGLLKIDRYDLVAEIASGGMATVFLARLGGVGGFQRFVAIKRLHPHLAKEKEFVEMFLDEARLAAGIHHPNVVPIIEVGASDRGYYLVMEYIEGDTLARLLARAAAEGQKVPTRIATRIMLDMLAGLHSAHELKDERGEATELVHRDVSPQNILVGIDGVSRITDFGVARAATRLSATRVGQLKGKIAYMAPEQAAGDPDVDRRADVFSAGIVMWELLAARRLFKAENEAATLSRVVSEPIPNLAEVAPDIPAALAEVCMKTLDRDRDARYATCALLADDLERAAAQADVVAAPREVAAYVSEVIGEDLTRQRDAVRAWVANSEPGDLESFSGVGRRRAPSSSGISTANVELSSASSGMVSHPQLSQISQVSEIHERKSRAPLMIGLAILLLAGIAAAILMMSGPSTVDGQLASQPGNAPATPEKAEPTAQPVDTAAAPPVDSVATTAESAEAPDDDPPKKPAAKKPSRSAGRWRPPAKPATKKPEKQPDPPPAKTAKPASTIDMSNPYK